MTYSITKTYGHAEGLSAIFRQWRAESHCAQLHGYALKISLTVEADWLDSNNWVFDFGSFKPIKAWLHANFDHKLLVAEDDPHLDELCALGGLGLAEAIVLPNVGCEAFCRYIANRVGPMVLQATEGRAWLSCVAVAEHEGNQARLYLDGEYRV